jgi:hypothetical protein
MKTDTKLAHWLFLVVSVLSFAASEAALKRGEKPEQVFDSAMFVAGMCSRCFW